MKLIIESNDLVESVIEEAAGTGNKSYFLSGPFINTEVQNRNGRYYPKSVMESQVANQMKLISEKRALGELNHPNGPTVNLDRVSHLITELNWRGNDVMGKAKVLDTPCGKIIKNFMDEGIKIGVSTRGMGSIKKNSSGMNEVQSDFRLICVDAVSDPSGPTCFVDGIMESADWIFDEVTNTWREAKFVEMKENIEAAVRENALNPEKKLQLLERWMQVLSNPK